MPGFVLTLSILWDLWLFAQWMRKRRILIERLHKPTWEAMRTLSRLHFTGRCWCSPLLTIQQIKSRGDSFEDYCMKISIVSVATCVAPSTVLHGRLNVLLWNEFFRYRTLWCMIAGLAQSITCSLTVSLRPTAATTINYRYSFFTAAVVP